MADTDDAPIDCESPPCLLGESEARGIDPAYFGYLGRRARIDLLNLLLECERAGARGIPHIAEDADPSADLAIRAVLREIAEDEARFCAMLADHITRLGGTPSTATGAFYQKLIALDTLDRRLDLLDRGQSWVAEKLRAALPKLPAGALLADLAEMLAAHDRNIARARAFA